MSEIKKVFRDFTEEQLKFKELTLIQKYDAVLDALYDLSGDAPTFDDIDNKIISNKKKVHGGEIWDILNKMRRDFIIRERIFKNDDNLKEIYLIDFEGKLMKEKGGLKGKIKRENFTTTRVTILEISTFILAAVTLFYTTCTDNDKELKKMNETLKERLQTPINNSQTVPPAVNHTQNTIVDTLDSVPEKK